MCKLCVVSGDMTQEEGPTLTEALEALRARTPDETAQETMDTNVDATMAFIRDRRAATADLGTDPVNIYALAESLAGEIMFKVNHSSAAFTLVLLALRLQDALDRESGTIAVNKPPTTEGDANTGFYV